jgi:hypothetical protein
VTQGNLSGESGQNIEADGSNYSKADDVGHIKHVGIGNEREEDEKDKKEAQPEFDKLGSEDLFIFDVILLKITTAHSASTHFIVL